MIIRYFNRYIFDDAENRRTADVFFDRLDMCHTIDFENRLEVDYPTISLADLLLEKLQIVNMTEKDVKDCTVLLREHDIAEGEKDTINVSYILGLLSRDWGFYYTTKLNLEKIRRFVTEYAALTDFDRSDVVAKIDLLADDIEKAPKSSRWKMRASIGARQKRYREVEEVERTSNATK
jgi:hypothetical protein